MDYELRQKSGKTIGSDHMKKAVDLVIGLRQKRTNTCQTKSKYDKYLRQILARRNQNIKIFPKSHDYEYKILRKK